VVILGHIDHGKTSLLLAIRKLNVPAGKPGGVITQHIGAYQIEHQDKKITFIDTPGHEAFSQMRSRGAKVADIAILIVDATQGVQPQTREAILHIKKSGIPMIVTLNKIDKPEANPEKAKRELAKEEILVESMGGKIPSVEVSAKTGQGISDLLELISLVAEIENLRASLQKSAEGVVIEAYLDSQRGSTATLIPNQGILKPGQVVGTLSTLGKIKSLENFQGISISEAFPSQPVIVLGFENPPRVGEKFKVFSDIEEARANLKIREKKAPEVLEISAGQKVLNLILKADVLGSLEAIEEVLKNLPREKSSTKAGLDAGPVPHRNKVSGAGIILRILKSEVGEVNESDIKLAIQAKAKILGFRVKINPIARALAEREKIKIRQFDIIYDLVEDVRKYMEKLLEPEIVRTDLGKIKTLVIFRTEKNRQIVGGKVIEGEVKKGTQIEILREGEIIGKGKLVNLQKNKKDLNQVLKGEDCGILYEGEARIEEGDILVIYTEERRKL